VDRNSCTCSPRFLTGLHLKIIYQRFDKNKLPNCLKIIGFSIKIYEMNISPTVALIYWIISSGKD
ncbi:MAG: hypothetical protein ACKPGH_05925, partial [Dolichospermum sp.]